MHPEPISGPENNLWTVFCVFVLTQCFSWPGGFFADVTSVGDSSDMVCLYVRCNISKLSFFSTYFAYHHSFVLLSAHHTFSSVLHHWLDLIIQLIKINTDQLVVCGGHWHFRGDFPFKHFLTRNLSFWLLLLKCSFFFPWWRFELLCRFHIGGVWTCVAFSWTCEAFQPEIFSHSKEGIKILLENICFSVVEKVNYGHQNIFPHPSHFFDPFPDLQRALVPSGYNRSDVLVTGILFRFLQQIGALHCLLVTTFTGF